VEGRLLSGPAARTPRCRPRSGQRARHGRRVCTSRADPGWRCHPRNDVGTRLVGHIMAGWRGAVGRLESDAAECRLASLEEEARSERGLRLATEVSAGLRGAVAPRRRRLRCPQAALVAAARARLSAAVADAGRVAGVPQELGGRRRARRGDCGARARWSRRGSRRRPGAGDLATCFVTMRQ